MLTILTTAEVWQDVARKASTDYARRIVSTAYDLHLRHPSKTIGQCIYRARKDVAAYREFGRCKADTLVRDSETAIRKAKNENELQRLRDAIDTLADDERTIVQRTIAGERMTDIADDIGIAHATAYRWYDNAMETLRQEFGAKQTINLARECGII